MARMIDTGEEWYVGTEGFDVVYAIGDTHGDVGATIAVFRDLLGVVRGDAATGRWEWVRPRTAVVVLGDVVDRSRHQLRSESGENVLQAELPDDLYLLRLLNHWADLADGAQALLIRLVGNHEVFQENLRFSTAQDSDLLYRNLEQHSECQQDVQCNRRASFRKEGGAYFRAIWDGGHPRVVQQIGPWLFVHGGLTGAAVEYVAAEGPHNLVRRARAYAGRTNIGERIAPGLADFLETRTLAHAADTGVRARGLLDNWSRTTGRRTDFVAVGHSLQRPKQLARWSGHPAAPVVHALPDDPRATQTVYRGFRDPPRPAVYDRPWINASLDALGRPSVFRLDVGLSRCWGTDVCSQALAVFVRGNSGTTATVFNSQPSLDDRARRDGATGGKKRRRLRGDHTAP